MSKIRELWGAVATQVRNDGWVNPFSAMGYASRDSSVSSSVEFRPHSWEELEALYDSSAIAKTIINAVIDDSLASGARITAEDPDAADAAQTVLEDLEVWEVAAKAWFFARLYGGAAVLPVFRGGEAFDVPMSETPTGGRFIRWIVAAAPELTAVGPRNNDPESPYFGEFEYWTYSAKVGGTSIISRIHRSRLIFFHGADTSLTTLSARPSGWMLSELERAYEPLRNYQEAEWSMRKGFGKFSESILKTKGLFELLAARQKDVLETRMGMFDLLRSANRTLLLDAEEEYDKLSSDFTNLDKVFDKFAEPVASAAGMPFTRLFGRSPAGLNATGESDSNNWELTVTKERTKRFLPGFSQLVDIALSDAGMSLESWEVAWPAIRIETATEKAQTYKTLAEGDATYVNAQIFMPEEIARGRMTANGYQTEPRFELDESERADFAAARAAEFAAAGAPDPAPAPDENS